MNHQVGEGTYSRYTAGCRCEECREANRVYMRDYKARRKAAGGRGSAVVRTACGDQSRRTIRSLSDRLRSRRTRLQAYLTTDPDGCTMKA